MNYYVEEFRRYMIKGGKSQNTVNTYTQNAQLFVEWLEQITNEKFNGKILEMDASEYSRYLSDIKKQSLNTIKAKLTAVQKFSEYLASIGIMPDIKVQQKKGISEPEVEILENNEVYKYLRCVRESKNKLNIAIIVLLLNTGIRESELCNLELSDVTISDRKGVIIIRSGKGNKYREIPLNVDARNALNDYILNARPSDAETEKVFIGQRGALTRNAIYKIVSKMGLKYIGKKVYPHMLRHQCFTAMAKNNKVDLKTISSLAGHSSIELTMKYYINSSKQEKIDAVEKLQLF